MKNENIITLDELGEVALSKLIRSHPYDIDPKGAINYSQKLTL